MRRRSLMALVATVGVVLPSLSAGFAFADEPVPAEDVNNCNVTENITGEDLTAKIAGCEEVTFSEDVTVTGSTSVSKESLVTFIVNEGKSVTFTTLTGNALNVNGEFTFENRGTVNFLDVADRGIAVSKSANILLKGTEHNKFTFNNVNGYAFFGAEGKTGSLTVTNATFESNLSKNQVEGAFNTGKGFTTTWNNSNITITDARNNEKFNKINAAHTVVYAEGPWEFTNGSVVNSESNVYYNFSFVGANLTVTKGASVTLATNKDALMVSCPMGFCVLRHPQVGVNTKDNTVTISDGAKLEVVDNVAAPHDKHGIEFQNATYKVDNGTLITPSAGRDFKSNAENKLIITGDSKVQIGNGGGEAIDPKIKTTINGGTVVLPPNTTGVTNDAGDPLKQFVSDTKETSFTVGDNIYKVSKVSNDGKKHVWAPPVEVTYYPSKEDAEKGPKSENNPDGVDLANIITRTVIKDNSVASPFNGVEPVDGDYKKLSDNEPFTNATLVNEDMKVYKYTKPVDDSKVIPVPPVPVPTAPTEPTKPAPIEPVTPVVPTTPVVKPGSTSHLASTGASSVAGTTGVGLVLLLGGAVTLVLRRKRQH